MIDMYADAVYEMYGIVIDKEDTYRHMAAGTLITSFLYWHEYLHGASRERVEQVYGKMAESWHITFPCN